MKYYIKSYKSDKTMSEWLEMMSNDLSHKIVLLEFSVSDGKYHVLLATMGV